MSTILTGGLIVPRRKVFISYFHGDRIIAQAFVDSFAKQQRVFIPKAIGLSYDEDDLIDSTKPDYVIEQIRQKYIEDDCDHGNQHYSRKGPAEALAPAGMVS